ncbi:EAL domain-containing protein [Roseibium aestuarii]|uniref:EAL domain-containing protein n=1 Tax=Roseibium aestuarii TaxID=2600299 RepID=A0ABW4JS57_9HYPH|nr:EAL domain-containing protein [Roseibium aestuarii]
MSAWEPKAPGSDRRETLKRLRTCVLVALVALVSAFGLKQTGHLSRLSLALLETRHDTLERHATGSIVFVDIDARSLQEVGVWPWPRSLYGKALDRLTAAGVSDIAFDIDFSSRSTPNEDLAFAQALRRAGDGVGLATFRQPAKVGGRTIEVINRPIETLREVSWPVLVSVPVAVDGRVWSAIEGDLLDEEVTLSLAAFLSGGETQAGRDFLIDYGIDPATVPVVPFVDLLNGHVSPAVLSGRKIVIGASAQELRDLFSVPVHGVLPGAMIQILAAESLMQGRDIHEAGWLLCLMLTVILAIPLSSLGRIDWKARVALLVGLSAVLEILSLVLQSRSALFLDTAPSQLAIAMILVSLMARQISWHRLLLGRSRIQVRNSGNILGRVFDDSFDGIVVVDDSGRIQAMSRSANRILPEAVRVGANAERVLPGVMAEVVREVLARPFDWTPGAAEIREVRIEDAAQGLCVVEFVVAGSTHLEFEGAAKTPRETRLASITCRDVTEQRRAADRLRHMARHDTVTGLLNRNGFETWLLERTSPRNGAPGPGADPAHATGQGLSCLALFAVDQRDAIIASLGFQAGDLLSAAVAERLRRRTTQDVVLASIGDNRFAVLFPVAADAEAQERLNSLLELGSGTYELGGNRVIVTLRGGFTLGDPAAAGLTELLREAGNALSVARSVGEHVPVRYRESMTTSLSRRQTLDMEMANALARGQIRAVFQPLIDLASGSIMGVETLMRWHHPSLGEISPAEFIPVAEQSGRIGAMGAHVLGEALRQAGAWSRPLRVAVNVSPVQFSDPGFVDMVERALEETGFPAERLDLELTESLFVHDRDGALDHTIARLQALGCSLALDDFGTGYSSLGYIPRIPFSKIKIDKSFIDHLETDEASRAIVEIVVGLARRFQMQVVAEGVERGEQNDLLWRLGCNIGQGYLYGRPMSAEDIQNLLRKAA